MMNNSYGMHAYSPCCENCGGYGHDFTCCSSYAPSPPYNMYDVQCDSCGNFGHTCDMCPSSQMNMYNVQCGSCGIFGHSFDSCPSYFPQTPMNSYMCNDNNNMQSFNSFSPNLCDFPQNEPSYNGNFSMNASMCSDGNGMQSFDTCSPCLNDYPQQQEPFYHDNLPLNDCLYDNLNVMQSYDSYNQGSCYSLIKHQIESLLRQCMKNMSYCNELMSSSGNDEKFEEVEENEDVLRDRLESESVVDDFVLEEIVPPTLFHDDGYIGNLVEEEEVSLGIKLIRSKDGLGFEINDDELGEEEQIETCVDEFVGEKNPWDEYAIIDVPHDVKGDENFVLKEISPPPMHANTIDDDNGLHIFDPSFEQFYSLSKQLSLPLFQPTPFFEDCELESEKFDDGEVKLSEPSSLHSENFEYIGLGLFEVVSFEVDLEVVDTIVDDLDEGGDAFNDVDEPLFEKFEDFFCGEDEFLVATHELDLISLTPLLEVMFDERESVSTDFEGNCGVHLLGEPIFEKFEAPFCGEDEFPIPTCDLDLISYVPLLEVVTFDVEYDAPFLDKACMMELLETPLLFICDDDCDASPFLYEKFVFEMDELRGEDTFDGCDTFSSLFDRFVFDMDGLHDEVKDKETSEVSFVVDCPLLVGFGHSSPMEEKMFYEIDFENVEENDHNLDGWRKPKDVSFLDKVKEMSGIGHRLWDPG